MIKNLYEYLVKECPTATVTQTGDLYIKAKCVFQNEKRSQSLAFSIPRQTFYCFSCHKRGDVDEYVRRYKLTNAESMEFIREWDNTLSIIKRQLERATISNNNKLRDQLLTVYREIGNLKGLYAIQENK